MSHTQSSDVAIIGGGLAGLAAAAYLARAGKSVTLFEKARELGGRATTHTKGGFRFNLAPHALYRGGRAAKVLKELGISFSGGVPNASNGYAIFQGKKHTLLGGFVSLLTTGLFGLSAKFELAQLLGSIPKIDANKIQHITVAQWLEQTIQHPQVRALIQTLFRLATYGNDPHHQSAGAALVQLQLALAHNVWYVDGGWQTLVDGLRTAAQNAGVQIVSEAKIAGIHCDNVVHGVCLADGSRHATTSVIIIGRERVMRFYMNTAARRSASFRRELRLINGMPALVAEWTQARPGQPPRMVLHCEVNPSGQITDLHAVVATRKLTAIQFSH